MKIINILLLVIFAFAYPSCKNKEEKRMTRRDVSEAKKKFEKINKILVNEDRFLIEGYIKRYRLDGIKETGTGLYYLVWGNSEGDSIRDGNVVEFSYKVTLLDGTLCYQSEPGKPKKFKVGVGGVESGLEQAVMIMKKGQKGKFILPPHLAHGLLGDVDKIPSRSIIVYDIEMLNVYH
jgi:FKBP-type peptidyl-prolyl cis-trans isomerase